ICRGRCAAHRPICRAGDRRCNKSCAPRTDGIRRGPGSLACGKTDQRRYSDRRGVGSSLCAANFERNEREESLTMASVTSTYARAFADVVLVNRLDPAKTLSETQQIAGLVRENKELRDVWENPSIPSDQKRAVLDSIVKRAGISQPVRNFVAVVMDKGRMKFFGEIVEQFREDLNQQLGIADAEITTARDLSAAERAGLERDLAQVTGKKIKARYDENRAILGGVIARVGSTVFDGSVKGQLERIRRQLVST